MQLSHWVYVKVLMTHRRDWEGDLATPCSIIFGFAYAGSYSFKLLPHLPLDLRIPVFLYAFTFACMIGAATRAGGWAWFGAVWFAASDSILAWNKFVSTVPYNRLAILGTYWLAQALLAFGLSHRLPYASKRRRVRGKTPEEKAKIVEEYYAKKAEREVRCVPCREPKDRAAKKKE